MDWLEQLPPGERLIAAAILVALMVRGGLWLVRLADYAIDLAVDAWRWLVERRDARRRRHDPEMWRYR